MVKNVIEKCDIVLVMSVFPGFGGQSFISSVIDKIKQIRAIINSLNKDILLEVDGGINFNNSMLVKQAGANVLVAGSTVFNSSNRADAIEKLRNE